VSESPPVNAAAIRKPTVAGDMAMFWRMLASGRRASRTAAGSLAKSSAIRATSAVSQPVLRRGP
jgi:hypothetical protein